MAMASTRCCTRYRLSKAKPRANGTQPKRFKVYEKNGTLRISVAAVKHIGEAKRALEPAVASALTDERGGEGPA